MRFRPDIEGLRAIAIGAVLLYHAQLPWARGGFVGVDVFFVVSGFLITRLLVRELEETGTLSLRRFYARRMRRLLPAIAVVLAAVVALSLLVLSPVEQLATAWDVVASGLSVVNWRLAAQAVDYNAAGLDASAVQHFWTLAVEEQFYLAWPVLLLAVTWWWRRRGNRSSIRRVIAAALLAVGLSSLAYSVHLTHTDAAVAYFSTLTRAHELTIGAAIALITTERLRYPRAIAALLGWGGLAAIAWSTAVYDNATAFPGAATLVPTLGAAAVILAGFNDQPVAATRLLGVKPLRHIGRLSYSWYLWHWPALVFAAAYLGDLRIRWAVAITVLSYIPAWLTHTWVERPVHHHAVLQRHPRRAMTVGVACTAWSVMVGLALAAVPQSAPAPPTAAPGAAVAETQGIVTQASADRVRPSPLEAYDDRSKMHDDGCLVPFGETQSPPCVYGHADADTTVVLFGDSTAMHYFPALEPIARRRGWRLIGLTKAGCSAAAFTPFSAVLKREYTECAQWRDLAFRRIAQEAPAMVITAGRSGTRAVVDGRRLTGARSTRVVENAWVDTFSRLRRTGARVVLLRDGPRPDKDVPACVSEHMDDLSTCAFDRAGATDYVPTDLRAAKRVKGVHVVDVTSRVCNENRCPAVIGNVLVYRQSNHLTATYARTLSRHIGLQLPSPRHRRR